MKCSEPIKLSSSAEQERVQKANDERFSKFKEQQIAAHQVALFCRVCAAELSPAMTLFFM